MSTMWTETIATTSAYLRSSPDDVLTVQERDTRVSRGVGIWRNAQEHSGPGAVTQKTCPCPFQLCVFWLAYLTLQMVLKNAAPWHWTVINYKAASWRHGQAAGSDRKALVLLADVLFQQRAWRQHSEARSPGVPYRKLPVLWWSSALRERPNMGQRYWGKHWFISLLAGCYICQSWRVCEHIYLLLRDAPALSLKMLSL